MEEGLYIVLAAVAASYIWLVHAPSWAIVQRARIPGRTFYLGTDRAEYERRYRDLLAACSRLMGQYKAGSCHCDILATLNQIRCNPLFDIEVCRVEYDVLYAAIMFGNNREQFEEYLRLGGIVASALPEGDPVPTLIMRLRLKL
jgi:hypothetical protein